MGDKLTVLGLTPINRGTVEFGPLGRGDVLLGSAHVLEYSSIETFETPNTGGGVPFLDAVLAADAGNGRDNGVADQYLVARLGESLEVFVNGSLFLRRPVAEFETFSLLGSSDPDSVTIDYSGGDPIPSGGFTFDGQGGNDSLTINDAAGTGITNVSSLVDGAGGVIDTGGGGSNCGTTWVVTADSVTCSGSPPSFYHDLKSLVLNTGGSADTVNVLSTSTRTTISTVGGADQVFVGDAGSVLDINGSVTIDNLGSSTTLFVDGSADTTGGRTVVVSETVVTGLAPASITVVKPHVVSASFSTGQGADTILVRPGTSTRLFIHGNEPTTAPGDRLILSLTGVTNPVLTRTGNGSGEWTFDNRRQVDFTGIEDVSIAPAINVVTSPLEVRLHNLLLDYGADGYVLADAIRIELLGSPFMDSAPVFSEGNPAANI